MFGRRQGRSKPAWDGRLGERGCAAGIESYLALTDKEPMFQWHDRQAGQFAREHYQALRRKWLGQVVPVLPIVLIPVAGYALLMSRLFPQYRSGMVWLGVGVTCGIVVVLLDSPPEWIAKWQRGWHGERRTAKALRRLEKRGWTIAHGLVGRWRDRDHIVAGPSGVYLLETKNLSGRLTLEGGVLTAQRGDDPIDSWSYTKLGGAVRGAALETQRELKRYGVRWVKPVVVLWGDFRAGQVEADGVVYLHGSKLRAWLEHQHANGQQHHLDAITEHLRAAPRAQRIVRS